MSIAHFITSYSLKTCFVLIAVLCLSSCGYSVINEACPNCKTTELSNSDLILVTNQEGKSNVFSKSENRFLLANWYPAVYDEGLFYDDITFDVNGEKVVVSESNYGLISDDYLLGKNQSEDNKKEEKATPTKWPCNQCDSWFTHSGYKINPSGECEQLEEPHQGFHCSCACARNAKNNFDNAVDDALNYNR